MLDSSFREPTSPIKSRNTTALVHIPSEVVKEVERLACGSRSQRSALSTTASTGSTSRGRDTRPSIIGFFTETNEVAPPTSDVEVDPFRVDTAAIADALEEERPNSPTSPFEYDELLDVEFDDDDDRDGAASPGTITPGRFYGLPASGSSETIRAVPV